MKEALRAIQKEIKQRQAQIRKNQAESKSLANEIKELKRALALIGGTAKPLRRKRTGPTIPDLVEKVLKEAGRPLHVKEISRKIGVGAARVSASLQRFLKEGKRFKRTARATFSLGGAIKKRNPTARKSSKRGGE
ncbi:hypothetical protein MYX82_02450 [Acidobacteria bacterium AH-259-D05]|nr:hypothetical protein [Acidobacteria bacterium AH-259-D05]